MRFSGSASISASACRTRCGTWVPSHRVSLPSPALQSATPARPSSGAAVCRFVRKTRSITAAADASVASTWPLSNRRARSTLPGAASCTTAPLRAGSTRSSAAGSGSQSTDTSAAASSAA